jgi:hypothetical protein
LEIFENNFSQKIAQLLRTRNSVLMPSSRKDFFKLACDLAEDILTYSTVKNQAAARGFYCQFMNRYPKIFV